jgi:hypothetical protein
LDQEGYHRRSKSGFEKYGRVSLGADVIDRLKLKTNVIYTYFNRKTLPENGQCISLLNAVNAPSTISPYDDEFYFYFLVDLWVMK